MIDDKDFEITYETEDGYCGGSRPHHVGVSSEDVSGICETALRMLFWEIIQDAFEQTVHPVSDQEDEFVQWALQTQEETESE